MIAACILLAPACLPAGEVYRWVDEQGRIHYGDRPPAEGATRMEISDAPAADPENLDTQESGEKLLEVLEDDREARENQKAKTQAEADVRRANCERVQAELERMRNAAYLLEQGGDASNPRILDEQERLKATAAMEREAGKWCGAAARAR